MRPSAAENFEGEENKQAELHPHLLGGDIPHRRWVRMLNTGIVARRPRMAERFELAPVGGKIARAQNSTAPIGIYHHKSDPCQKVSPTSEHSSVEFNG
jgi:hypothetical protein